MACSLFGMSAIGKFYCNDKNVRTGKIIPYRTILITGLWLVRKINISFEYVNQEKCIYFMSDIPFLLLFTFFSKARLFIFYSLNIFIVRKGVKAPFLVSAITLLDIPPLSFKTSNPPPFNNYHGKILDSMMIYWN